MVPDKFALSTFNRLAYNREISGLLVASYLIRLPDHYTLLDNMKSINLAIFWKRFSEFTLQIYKPKLAVNDFIKLRRQISAFLSMFNHYCCWKSKLQNFCFFIYVHVVSIFPWQFANSSDIEFESSYLIYQTHMQQHWIKPGSQAEVKLLGLLFDNDGLGNIIFADNLRTVKGHNNITIVLLALFVS